MRKLLPASRAAIGLAVLAAIVVATGVATGAIPGADGTVTACYKAKGGALRVIDAERGATCAADETRISWNQQGPTGPEGPKGDKGDAGPQAPAACDAAGLLLCPDADLPTGHRLVLTIDGVEFLHVSRYRINCTTNGGPTCELVLTGPALGSRDVNAWFQVAFDDPETAMKSFTLNVNDASGTTIRKFFVSDGRPTELLNQGDSFQLTLTAERVQQITV